jgi:hypothetical protein
MSLFKWVDHTGILLIIFFGPECPLVKEFKILAELLQDPEYFHNYTPINWAAQTWKAHLDAQAFFNHKGVGSQAITSAQQTTLDIASNVLPLDHPVLFQACPLVGDPRGPSGIQWNLLEGGAPASKRQKPNKRTTVCTPASAQGATMAAQFCPLINQAAATVPNLRASMLWKSPDTIAQLLGPRFPALVPANRNPCLRYHIFGSCTSINCQFMHKLTPARPKSGHSHGNPGSGQSPGRGVHCQGPTGKRIKRDRVCAPAPLPQHLATGMPLPSHRRGPDWEASLQMLTGATPVGQENPKSDVGTPPSTTLTDHPSTAAGATT